MPVENIKGKILFVHLCADHGACGDIEVHGCGIGRITGSVAGPDIETVLALTQVGEMIVIVCMIYAYGAAINNDVIARGRITFFGQRPP